jgi:flagellar biosynthetic protein FliR
MTLGLPLSTLWAFLLVLARTAGVVAFLPIPAFRSAPAPARVVLTVTLTLALFPVWPVLPNAAPSMGQMVWWAMAEATFGLAIGVAVGFLVEGFQLAMQIIGLQAGYGYSVTVDPTSQADSGVLQVFFMLITGLLFFSFGIDREVIRILALSFDRFPAGSWAPSLQSMDGVIELGGQMMILGLRLAFPIAALLLLVDVALALLGRMQQQLQLITLAFPIKMLAAVLILGVLAPMIPRMFEDAAARTVRTLSVVLTP